MLPKERRNMILEQLNKNEKIDIEQLVEQLNVSAMTIRRDLAYLEDEEKIIRTHGGAILNKPLIIESSFHTKEGKHSHQKRQIAQKALNFIQNHSTILLDSGTTTLEIAKLLKDKKDLTVVTNDIKIAAELMDSEVKVIVAGGELQNNVGTLFGPLTEQILKNLHVDLFFLGAHAIHLEAGITAPTFEKASIKKLMIEAAETTWLVADSSKFDQKSLTKVCDLSSIYGVITDDGITDECEGKIKEHLQVITAHGGEVK
ncbi:DeoR/GlpR family DNA-binding transcription regulator [Metabacillus arenae]|uniref:DeoR/GlpR transcriptional regulator n=1 Tax=Metabacillus arenae TaxID=2771434 RepID=A0A926NLK9_9BACI|nr:DeoR/GlpR family DNA-binding transcription regulator [Metabacillus arenae]MBD1382208.1 DeoR/GlpR transcriptional regulator [Metabacillus arenae]